MFCRYEAWENVDSARGDRKVVVTPTILLATIFEDAHATPFRSISRGQLLEPDGAVGDAVGCLVSRFRGQVIQQDHSGAITGEILLDRQEVAPISERALSHEANFRETVEHHATRLRALDSINNLLGRLAKLKVIRLEKALLLFLDQ
jgi:hypothetical protein